MVLVLMLSGDSPQGTTLREARHYFLGLCGGEGGSGTPHLKAFPPKPSDGITWELLGVLFTPVCFQSAFISVYPPKSSQQSVEAWVSYQPHFTKEAEARGGKVLTKVPLGVGG